MGRNWGDALRLAARQDGVLRRDQALAAGLTTWQVRHAVRRGLWSEVFPCVYRVAGAPWSRRQDLRAAALWAARGAAVSHGAAASLLGFERYADAAIELSVTRHLRAPPGIVVHQVGRLDAKDLTTVGGIPVTSATRTLLDLAATEPEDMVKAALDQALRRKWTTLDKLDVATERAGWRRGVALIRALVTEYRGGNGPTESELESRVRELLEQAGLVDVERQRRVVIGGRVRRLDFRVTGTPVLIEADGYAWHSTPEDFERDRARDNALIARGYRVLRWTWAAVRDQPDVLLVQLLETLRRCAFPAPALCLAP
ncbi:MAG: type IV toxin-antitoxin system AbiEi family antitoxin domain-containing protein [Myxococcota bacterium]